MRIEHINLTVNDIDASTAFYRQLLGGDVRWEGLSEEGQRSVHLGDKDTYLALFEATNRRELPIDYGSTGFNHVGFEVDDLQVFKQRLEQMGVPLRREEEYEPGQRLYVLDPDGHEIELVQYT